MSAAELGTALRSGERGQGGLFLCIRVVADQEADSADCDSFHRLLSPRVGRDPTAATFIRQDLMRRFYRLWRPMRVERGG